MNITTEQIVVDKLVHGGQALSTLSTGKKAFIWNALPGERLVVELKKSKKGYSDGIATKIIEPSADRIEPRDEAYLSTSPWQIMTPAAEQNYKADILNETFEREHVSLPAVIGVRDLPVTSAEPHFEYRNKMEYSFWGDDDGLHLALFHRASHGKRIVQGSSIAMPAIDKAANAIVKVLDKSGVRGSSLKTVILRSTQDHKVVAALFVKDEAFPEIDELSTACEGMVVYYSNPKSPASLPTKELYSYGDTSLTDTILGTPIRYDVTSFFQVNIPVFSQALTQIKDFVDGDRKIIDMYSGVGSIGIVVGASTLVELDPTNVEMARTNVAGTPTRVVLAASEKALEYISPDATLIVDPPRAGLHATVIDQINAELPPKIAYLSCNPITQARDLAMLQDHYVVEQVTGYNFFPRTPHIESLALLRRR